MYQSEILRLKDNIHSVPNLFEACNISNSAFNGIEILGVRKIPNSRGLHGVFIDLEDYRGNDYVTILNNQTKFPFTKPRDEVACHVDIYSTNNRIQIVGNERYSQIVEGLSFAHTTWGHSSYYVYAKFTNSDVITPPPTETEQKRLIREIEERLTKLKEIV